MNSKYYENPNKRAFKEIKTIANTITGTGSMISRQVRKMRQPLRIRSSKMDYLPIIYSKNSRKKGKKKESP